MGSSETPPQAAALDAERRLLYVLLTCDDCPVPVAATILVLDADTLEVEGKRGIRSALDVAVASDGTVFVARSGNRVEILASKTLKRQGTLKLPHDAALLEMGPDTLFVRGYDEKHSIVSSLPLESLKISGTYRDKRILRGLANNDELGRVYVVGLARQILVFDEGMKPSGSIPVGKRSSHIVSRTSSRAYVLAFDEDEIQCIDVPSSRPCWTAAVGGVALGQSSDGRTLFVADPVEEQVVFLSDQGKIGARIDLENPTDLVVDDVRSRVIVLQIVPHSISIIG